jgi:hypothetical protein
MGLGRDVTSTQPGGGPQFSDMDDDGTFAVPNIGASTSERVVASSTRKEKAQNLRKDLFFDWGPS